MIKAVTFDLDGVYFTAESFKRFKNNLPKRVTDEGKVNWVLYKSPQMLSFKCGQLSENEYWQFVKDELGVSISNEEIFVSLRESYEVNAEVHQYLLKVKGLGFKTCICSNNFITRIRELERKFDFLKNFDVKIFSYQVGVLKPDLRIFQELVGQAGVKPEEIVYSDDDASKLSGAIDLGINAFVYEGFEKFKEKVDLLIK